MEYGRPTIAIVIKKEENTFSTQRLEDCEPFVDSESFGRGLGCEPLVDTESLGKGLGTGPE